MTPYYEDEWAKVYRADALDLLSSLDDDSVQLVATDPPYYGVKEHDWDNAWPNQRSFLLWMRDLCREWRRVLAPNGSLYVFASPQMAHGVERVVRRHFRVLNAITWVKRNGWHRKAEKEAQRSFAEPWERAVFAEQRHSDKAWEQSDGGLRAFVFAPVREYLVNERDAAGMTTADVDREWQAMRGTKGCMAGHWFGATQWELPTAENYEWLRGVLGSGRLLREYEDLRREYEDLRREYEDLRREYEDLRRPFNATPETPYTDVWDFPTVSSYPGKHPTEKPLAMMKHIVRISSRPGDTVLDTFSGSGTTAEAARNLGRKAIVGDNSPHWVHQTAERLSQGVLRLEAS